nr:hypothetical protein [Tanacetum cinerariifolium]
MGIFDEDEDEESNMFLNGDGGGDDDVDLGFAEKHGRTLEDIEDKLLKGLLTNLGHVYEITLRNNYVEATATVHHHSIRFKMNNKKRIVNLKYFKEMLYICLRIPNQIFNELSFEEEILAFLRYLGYSGEIKKITDRRKVLVVPGVPKLNLSRNVNALRNR